MELSRFFVMIEISNDPIFTAIIANPKKIEDELQKGAERAREISVPYMEEIRNAVGIRKLN